jgi:DNA polymerase-3 subunit epsilon
MTRGQNALSMDVEEEVTNTGELLEVVALADIIVVRAGADELAQHQDVLGGLDKQIKGSCVWRNYADA